MHNLEGLAEPALRQAQAAAVLAHPVGDEALEVVEVADLADVALERGELQLDDVDWAPLTEEARAFVESQSAPSRGSP